MAYISDNYINSSSKVPCCKMWWRE